MYTEKSFLWSYSKSATQISDDSVMSEINFESNVLTVSTVPTNIDTIPYYYVNNDVPSWIEKYG